MEKDTQKGLEQNSQGTVEENKEDKIVDNSETVDTTEGVEEIVVDVNDEKEIVETKTIDDTKHADTADRIVEDVAVEENIVSEESVEQIQNVKEDNTTTEVEQDQEETYKEKAVKSFISFKENVESEVSGFIPFMKSALRNPDTNGKLDNKTILITVISWALITGMTLVFAIAKFVSLMMELARRFSPYSSQYYGSSNYFNFGISYGLVAAIRLAIFYMLAFAVFVAVDYAMSKLILKNEDSYLTILSKYVRYLIPVSAGLLLSVILLIINLHLLGLLGLILSALLFGLSNTIGLTKTEKFQRRNFSKAYYAITVLVITGILNFVLSLFFNIF